MEKKYFKYFFICILVLSISITAGPIYIYCDSINPDTTQDKDFNISKFYNNESKNTALDSDIYIIIITSIIIFGMMVFAMWKTIRSRKQL